MEEKEKKNTTAKAKDVKEAAASYVAEVKEAVEPVKKAAKTTAKKVAEKTSTAKKTVKKVIDKAAEKSKTVKAVEEAAEKTTKTVEKVAAKTTAAGSKVKKAAKTTAAKAKKLVVKEEMIVQYAGKSFGTDDLVKMAKEVWKKEMRRKVKDFGSVTLYVKPEENMVYFVVNGIDEGKFSI